MGNTAEHNSNFSLHNPEDGLFTMLWNKYVILNKSLSDREMRMLSVFLSLTKEIEITGQKKRFYKQDVYEFCAKSHTTNDKTFKALKAKGHIKQIRRINQDDNTLTWCYEIYQKPLDAPVEQYVTEYIYEGRVYDTVQLIKPKVKKETPDTILQMLLAEYPDTDPSVLASIASKYILEGNDAPPSAQEQQPQQGQQEQNTYYATLCNDKQELNKVIQKYEITEEELSKHLENFKAAKTAHHVSYESYHQHFSNYVGKSLEAVKKVVKHRPKVGTQKLSPPKYTKSNKEADSVATLKDDELLEKARELYKGIDPSQGWEQYRNNTDAFIKVAEKAKERNVGTPKLYSELMYFENIRRRPGALKMLFEKELTEKTKPPEDG